MANYQAGSVLAVERITDTGGDTPCDVCGSDREVAQVICVLESPTGDADGLANVVNICSRCGAYIIQVTTGFRACRQLANWYRIRELHPKLTPASITTVAEMEGSVD